MLSLSKHGVGFFGSLLLRFTTGETSASLGVSQVKAWYVQTSERFVVNCCL